MLNRKNVKVETLTAQQKYAAWVTYLDSIHGKSDAEQLLDEELKDMAGDESAIEARFGTELVFRSFGIEAELGTGTNRMNLYTVRRATMGLANFILSATQQDEGYDLLRRGVVIGFDSRIHSRDFALEAAKVLSNYQIQAYLFDEPVPIPNFSFSIRARETLAGLYVTSNSGDLGHCGLKMYDTSGCELADVAANDLNAFIQAQSIEKYLDDAWKKQTLAYITHITQGSDDDYEQEVINLLLSGKSLDKQTREFPIVVAPMRGVARATAERIAYKAGLQALWFNEKPHTVARQVLTKLPVKAEDEVYADLLAFAHDHSAKLVMVMNYTGTQLGVFVEHEEDYRWLSGNQVAALLLNYILETKKIKTGIPKNPVIFKDVFATELTRKIAEKFKVETEDVPVGFAYIGQKMDECAMQKNRNFLFGFEPDNRFVIGNFVRVPDATQVMLMVADMATTYHKKNLTLVDKLAEIERAYGCFVERSRVIVAGVNDAERLRQKIRSLRYEPPRQLGYEDIVRVEDFPSRQSADYREVGTREIAISPFNAVKWHSDKNSWAGVDFEDIESGLVVYYGTSSTDRERAEFNLVQIEEFVDELFAEHQNRTNLEVVAGV